MAITQADVDRLEAALASGTMEVEYDGRRVKYASVDGLVRAIGYAKAQLAATAGSPRRLLQPTTFNRD